LKLLILSFYFQPDLCAGSFRTTALVDALCQKLDIDDSIEIVTTMPNRYKSLINPALVYENHRNVTIRRIPIPNHESGFIDQALAFWEYWKKVRQLTENQKYDLIYVTSARFFTAFLGAKISNKKRIKLYLDIRDILSDTVRDIIRNPLFKFILLPIIRRIEKYTIQSASHLNLVSEGFKDSFVNYTAKTTYFTNGIDNIFLETNFEKTGNNKPKIITYAGNIGEGQGLEKIIPNAAKRLRGKFIFNVIGDGSIKKKLLSKLSDLQIDNVNIINPVNRNELIKYYQESDFLFLHLNNYEAFKKVLPSKIFEYGASKKPIIAGVNGYARAFIKENLNDALIFEPSNVEELVEILKNYRPQFISREDFIEKFSREAIFDEMTDTILELISSRKMQAI
jgi:glycosyltransferase involved in cell wall biosynthesis